MRFLVSGRVQGVFFRVNTQKQAEQLNLAGYAHNLADGCVEVIACGKQQAVKELETWLSLGPKQADVSSVVSEMLPMQKFADFSIG